MTQAKWISALPSSTGIRIGMLAFLQLSTIGCNLLVQSYLSYKYDMNTVGHYAYICATVNILQVLTSLGWPVVILRLASEKRLTALDFINKTLTSIVLAIGLSATIVLISSYYDEAPPRHVILTLCSLLIIRTALCMVKPVMDGSGLAASFQLQSGILQPAAILLLLSSIPNLDSSEAFGLIAFTSALITAAIYWFVTKSKKNLFSRLPSESSTKISSTNIWLVLSSSANIIITNNDVLVSSLFFSPPIAGCYGIIIATNAGLAVIATAGNIIYAPLVSKHIQSKNPEAAKLAFKDITKNNIKIAAIPLCLLFAFHQHVLAALSDNQIPPELRLILPIYLISTAFNIATGPGATGLFMKGDIRFVSLSTLIIAAINIVSSAGCAYFFGPIGLAIGSATSIIMLNSTLYIRSYKMGIS